MSELYEPKINFFHANKDINKFSYLNKLPDNCPVCNYHISPEYIFLYHKTNRIEELLCGCPRNDCGSLFFTVYQRLSSNSYTINRYYPYSRLDKEFPEEVEDLSPDFVEIYNQANHAENEGLNLICGVGYRKALEYLIKDYASSENPAAIEQIQIMPLTQCLKRYIQHEDIRDMAEMAVWLGNDETHYVRKWEDKDIQDLKKLIDLTVHFLTMTLRARRYRSEITR